MVTDSFSQRAEATQNRIQSFAFVINVIVCVLFCTSFAVPNFFRLRQSCEIEIESRINPNDASVASLVRLPGIGVGRADAIVIYRMNSARENGGIVAFESIGDMQKVKGIGPKTSQSMSEWLRFE